MNPLVRCALVLALLACPVAARAGDFNTNCSYVTEALAPCGEVFADIVTDRFIERFPVERYEIFVFSNVETNQAGDLLAYAVAGVVLHGSNDFPRRRFQSSRVLAKGDYTAGQLDEHELIVARDAVAWMMEKCGQTPSCEVFMEPEAATPQVEPTAAPEKQ
jgi:hypothetical protein